MRMPTRRRLLGLLLSTALATIGDRALGGPLDQGIGGTGVAPGDEADRGIGGTGVIGTIRKFGSIVVNDMRIAYPPDAAIRIDGRPASVADLKIGQVVRVDAAAGREGTYSTRVIDVASEVVGPVERARGKQIVVLGQTVSTASLKTRNFKIGETVAVSGLRRNDGTIVASLIERREGAPPRVSGPVRLSPDGSLRIGALALSDVDPALVGRRAVLEGQQDHDRFVVTRGASEAALLPSTVRTLSIETYVERRDGMLVLGSGFHVVAGDGIDVPPGRSVRAVLTTSIDRDGGLRIDNVRTGGRTYEPRGGGNGSMPGGGSREREPMDFGRGQGGASAPGGPSGGRSVPEGQIPGPNIGAPNIGDRAPGGFGGGGGGFGGPAFGGPGSIGGGRR